MVISEKVNISFVFYFGMGVNCGFFVVVGIDMRVKIDGIVDIVVWFYLLYVSGVEVVMVYWFDE